ncbi:MAG: Holliday junction resolvase RuvX [Halofilum sp. (in: g-proteobacteria)]|nr:Holliday junction resolvase RuvX [Halofilum sp. (in: g-proteobacteria)]
MSATYLGFDFGQRRIGMAAGQDVTRSASPLETIRARGGEPDWDALDRALRDWRPVALVVGIPVHMDGTEQRETRQARAFARRLAMRYRLPVHEADERLSSREAEGLLADARRSGGRRRTRKGDVDRMAASLILERWLAEHASD